MIRFLFLGSACSPEAALREVLTATFDLFKPIPDIDGSKVESSVNILADDERGRRDDICPRFAAIGCWYAGKLREVEYGSKAYGEGEPGQPLNIGSS